MALIAGSKDPDFIGSGGQIGNVNDNPKACFVRIDIARIVLRNIGAREAAHRAKKLTSGTDLDFLDPGLRDSPALDFHFAAERRRIGFRKVTVNMDGFVRRFYAEFTCAGLQSPL